MENNLSARDKSVIWHPYTAQKYAVSPIPIARGEGAYLVGVDGRRYLDCISSWWVTLHGHGHPYIAEKIYRQALELEQVIFAGFTHEPAVQLAERLLPLLPGQFSKVFYSDNGSTAVEVALKMAIQFWWNKGNTSRTKIFAFTNAYHGDTFGAMSVSGRSIFTAAFEDYLFEVIYLETPTDNNLDHNKKIIDTYGDETACFIYEPLLQGAGGMNMYSAENMDLLLSHILTKEIICIADEVLTGFYRTGSMFAGEKISNKAEIICLSKGLTGGTMAMGITACSNRIHEAYITDDRARTFFHGHSFTANPIACAAALASLDLLSDERCQLQINMINSKHKLFNETLKQAGLPGGLIQHTRVLGTIIAFELNSPDKNYLNQSAASITLGAMEQSIFIRPLGNTIYLMPPYCITENELDLVYQTILSLLQKNTR